MRSIQQKKIYKVRLLIGNGHQMMSFEEDSVSNKNGQQSKSQNYFPIRIMFAFICQEIIDMSIRVHAYDIILLLV